MSLIAELLLKAKKRPFEGDIPPQLEGTLERRRRRSRKYVIIVAVVLLFFSGGVVIKVSEELKGLSKKAAVQKGSVASNNPQLIQELPIPDASSKDGESISLAQGPSSLKEEAGQRSDGLEDIAKDRSRRVQESEGLSQNSMVVEAVKGKGAHRNGDRAGKRSTTKKTPGENRIRQSEAREEAEPLSSSFFQRSLTADLRYRAISCEQLGDYECAIRFYKEALKIEPENFKLLNQIAYLYIKIRLPEEAIEHAEKARELNPGYVPGMVNLSAALLMKGQYSEAEKVLLEAMALEPANRKVLYNMAVLYEILERYDDAERLYKRLLSLGDDGAGDALRRLRLKKPSKE